MLLVNVWRAIEKRYYAWRLARSLHAIFRHLQRLGASPRDARYATVRIVHDLPIPNLPHEKVLKVKLSAVKRFQKETEHVAS